MLIILRHDDWYLTKRTVNWVYIMEMRWICKVPFKVHINRMCVIFLELFLCEDNQKVLFHLFSQAEKFLGSIQRWKMLRNTERKVATSLCPIKCFQWNQSSSESIAMLRLASKMCLWWIIWMYSSLFIKSIPRIKPTKGRVIYFSGWVENVFIKWKHWILFYSAVLLLHNKEALQISHCNL